jgi:hypothetical protein
MTFSPMATSVLQQAAAWNTDDDLARARQDTYDEAYDDMLLKDLADPAGAVTRLQNISIARAFVVWWVCVGARGAERPCSAAFGAGQQPNPAAPRHRFHRVMCDNLQGITAAAVRRLALKAGVRRVPDDPNFYKEVSARPPLAHDHDGPYPPRSPFFGWARMVGVQNRKRTSFA